MSFIPIRRPFIHFLLKKIYQYNTIRAYRENKDVLKMRFGKNDFMNNIIKILSILAVFLFCIFMFYL